MPITTIYFDVDQTLIDRKGDLLPGVEKTLDELYNYGYKLFAWSRGGHKHVKRMLGKNNILKYFKLSAPMEYGCLDKPDLAVDDSPEKITGQILKIEGRDDWTNFFTKFYGKETY
jgi:phosphoglycolate phosphatase-like HAD superfamily hydrolase